MSEENQPTDDLAQRAVLRDVVYRTAMRLPDYWLTQAYWMVREAEEFQEAQLFEEFIVACRRAREV